MENIKQTLPFQPLFYNCNNKNFINLENFCDAPTKLYDCLSYDYDDETDQIKFYYKTPNNNKIYIQDSDNYTNSLHLHNHTLKQNNQKKKENTEIINNSIPVNIICKKQELTEENLQKYYNILYAFLFLKVAIRDYYNLSYSNNQQKYSFIKYIIVTYENNFDNTITKIYDNSINDNANYNTINLNIILFQIIDMTEKSLLNKIITAEEKLYKIEIIKEENCIIISLKNNETLTSYVKYFNDKIILNFIKSITFYEKYFIIELINNQKNIIRCNYDDLLNNYKYIYKFRFTIPYNSNKNMYIKWNSNYNFIINDSYNLSGFINYYFNNYISYSTNFNLHDIKNSSNETITYNNITYNNFYNDGRDYYNNMYKCFIPNLVKTLYNNIQLSNYNNYSYNYNNLSFTITCDQINYCLNINYNSSNDIYLNYTADNNIKNNENIVNIQNLYIYKDIIRYDSSINKLNYYKNDFEYNNNSADFYFYNYETISNNNNHIITCYINSVISKTSYSTTDNITDGKNFQIYINNLGEDYKAASSIDIYYDNVILIKFDNITLKEKFNLNKNFKKDSSDNYYFNDNKICQYLSFSYSNVTNYIFSTESTEIKTLSENLVNYICYLKFNKNSSNTELTSKILTISTSTNPTESDTNYVFQYDDNQNVIMLRNQIPILYFEKSKLLNKNTIGYQHYQYTIKQYSGINVTNKEKNLLMYNIYIDLDNNIKLSDEKQMQMIDDCEFKDNIIYFNCRSLVYDYNRYIITVYIDNLYDYSHNVTTNNINCYGMLCSNGFGLTIKNLNSYLSDAINVFSKNKAIEITYNKENHKKYINDKPQFNKILIKYKKEEDTDCKEKEIILPSFIYDIKSEKLLDISTKDKIYFKITLKTSNIVHIGDNYKFETLYMYYCYVRKINNIKLKNNYLIHSVDSKNNKNHKKQVDMYNFITDHLLDKYN
jgi:hypothetical protein